MRHSLLGITLLVAAVPSLAAAAPYSVEEYERLDSLPPQEELERTGEALHRVLDAIMDMRVGPLLEAVDPGAARNPRVRDETLRDIARRDDPWFDERMHDSVGTATRGMGEMMSRMARLAPVLERSIDEMARGLDDAMREPPGPSRD